MSQSDLVNKSRKILLKIDAGDPLTHVLVLNSHCAPVRDGDGYGEVSVAISPGVYIFCFAAGNGIADVRVRIPEDAPDTIEYRPEHPVPFQATAPLRSGKGLAAEQADRAAVWSRTPQPKTGAQPVAELFLFVRNYGSSVEGILRGLRLKQLNSAEHVPGFEAPQFDDRQAQCLAYRLPLEPGAYRLCWDSGGLETSREQSIIAVAGWQIQVFLTCREAAAPTDKNQSPATQEVVGTHAERPLLPDFDSAALFMVRLNVGFDPADVTYRWCELTRLALQRGASVPLSALSKVVDRGRQQPILLLQAAYLLRREHPQAAAKITASLPLEFATSPDALLLRLLGPGSPDSRRFSITAPPLFHFGWHSLVKQSEEDPEVVPVGSFLYRIADAIRQGEGPWLSWVTGECGPDYVRPLSTLDKAIVQHLFVALQKWGQEIAVASLPERHPRLIDCLTHSELELLHLVGQVNEVRPAPQDLPELLNTPLNALIRRIIGLVVKLVRYSSEESKKKYLSNEADRFRASGRLLLLALRRWDAILAPEQQTELAVLGRSLVDIPEERKGAARRDVGRQKDSKPVPLSGRGDKIQIKMEAYDHELLDQMAKEIVQTAQNTQAIVKGPVPLPTKTERYTVLRSPHVDRKSREQFEIRTHKRLIEILRPTGKTIEALNRDLIQPPGVNIKIRVLSGIG